MRRVIIAVFGISVIFFISGCNLFNNSNSETGGNYVLSFDTNGGNEIEPMYVENNTSISLPIAEREGYTFLGWYADGEIYNSSFEVKEDLIFTAEWDINDYQILVYDKERVLLSTYTLEYNTDLALYDFNLNDLVEEGYILSGVFPKIPDKMPANDLEITLDQTECREIGISSSDISAIETTVYSDDYLVNGIVGPNEYIHRAVIYDLNDATYEREILNPNGTESSLFASNIHISGDHIIISDSSFNNDQGIIYIYKFSDTTYFRTIKGSNTIDNEMFGHTIYTQGDYIITVTDNYYYSYATNPTRIYIHKLSDESYRRVLNDPYDDDLSNFGKDIYLHDDFLIVNMPNEYSRSSNPFNANQTIILIYKLSDESYLRTITNDNIFAEEIHIDNDFLVIGSAVIDGSHDGLIYIYKFSDEAYKRIINSPIEDENDSLSSNIQIHDNYIVISNFHYNQSQGIVFVYRLDDVSYERIITGSGTTEDSAFGAITILQDDFLLVRSDIFTQGRVFVYKFSDETYERVISEPNEGDYCFGLRVLAFEENIIISSAKGRFYNEKGKIYIYRFDDEEYKRVIDEETLSEEVHFSNLLYIKNGFLLSMAVGGDTIGGFMYIYKFSDDSYKKIIHYIPKSLGFGEDFQLILSDDFLIIRTYTYSFEDQKVYVFNFEDF